MRLALDALQFIMLVCIAPLIRGVVSRAKARIQNRRGASIFRPYADLWKLFHKEDLIPSTSSPLFRLCPIILFTATLACAAFVPALHTSALLGNRGDFILLVYLLALGRFFLILGAMDGGSSFGGMGASREALVSTLAEAPLLLGLIAVAVVSHSTSIASIVQWTVGRHPLSFRPCTHSHSSRLCWSPLLKPDAFPSTIPTTHLELTMIHEAMVLEYSGPSLALIEWASATKLSLMFALLIALFVPWGIATGASIPALAVAVVAYVLKMASWLLRWPLWRAA